MRKLPLSQLLNWPLDFVPPQECPQGEVRPSQPLKQPRVEKWWHGNLQYVTWALVILLQVGCVKPGSWEVTFEGYFEGLNNNQYYCIARSFEGSRGHQHWFQGLVNPLTKGDRADYVVTTFKRILKFLKTEWYFYWSYARSYVFYLWKAKFCLILVFAFILGVYF